MRPTNEVVTIVHKNRPRLWHSFQLKTPPQLRPFIRHVLLLTLVFLCGSVPHGHAMTVLPPTFEELVDESARIVRGRVVAVEAFRAPSPEGGSVIKTRVTWDVSSVLKGAPATQCSLEFLGGALGGEKLVVPGMPSFVAGDEDFLFVEADERSLCPLLAAGHGRYRVKHEPATRRAFVARDNDTVLASVDEVALPLSVGILRRPPAAGLTPEDFEARVHAAIVRNTAAHANR